MFQSIPSVTNNRSRAMMHTAQDISSSLRNINRKPEPPKRPPYEAFHTAPVGVWQPPRTSIVINNITIPGGMFYTGTMLLSRDGKTNDPALINTSLPIEMASQVRKIGLGAINPYAVSVKSMNNCQKAHWETLSPAERGQYLEWLSSGRVHPDIPSACLMLYLFGLERRLLIDGPKEHFPASESMMLIQEVQRIAATYGARWEIKDTANRILAIVWANSHDPRFASDVPAQCDLASNSCLSIFPYYLATFTSRHNEVPVQVMQHWFQVHPDINRDETLEANPYYQKLFKLLFDKEFGGGYSVPECGEKLRIQYQAVNYGLGTLEYEFGSVLDVYNEPETLALFQSIIDRCRTSLHEYEEQLREQERNPIGALLRQPIDVRATSPELRRFGQLVSSASVNSVGCISVRDIYRAMGFKIPDKLDARIVEDIGQLLEMSCFQYAPNPKMHGHAFTIDDNILITPALQQPECSKAFEVLCVILRLGAIVAQSDEEVSQAEIDVLQDMILARKVLDDEQRASLLLWLHWCLNTPQRLDDIKQNLSSMEMPMREKISQILVRVAYADNVLDDRELVSLQALHKALGLPSTWLDLELSHHQFGSLQMPSKEVIEQASNQLAERDGMVYQHAVTAQREQDSVDISMDLNNALASICENAPVQQLQQVFAPQTPVADDAEHEIDIPVFVEVSDLASEDTSLNHAHYALLCELMQKSTWPRLEVFRLAIQFDLMADWAMKCINDAALDKFGAPIIIDGETVQIDINKASQLFQLLS